MYASLGCGAQRRSECKMYCWVQYPWVFFVFLGVTLTPFAFLERCNFFAYSWQLPAYSGAFSLTIVSGALTALGLAPLQKCVGDFCCINFGGFCQGLSWWIFLGTFPTKMRKKSGDKIRDKIRQHICEKSVLPESDPNSSGFFTCNWSFFACSGKCF